MAETTSRLSSPSMIFPYLAGGGGVVLFAVNDKIVVKTVWKFDPISPEYVDQQKDSIPGAVARCSR
jgi:hypothetical protein